MPLEIIQPGRIAVPACLCGPLRDFGFSREGEVYRNGGLTFAVKGRWMELREEANGLDEPWLSRDLGQPGLWKCVRNGAPPHRVFEIPSWAVSEQPDDERLDEFGPASFPSLLAWGLETRLGRVPAAWLPPAAEVVDGWLPRGALTVQTRGHLCHGESLLGPNRWALRVPILPRLAEDLPEPRRRVLAELAAEAQRQWAMVRVGVCGDTSPAALAAEVDFTGAPHCELLFSAGLDVLRHVVAWLAETADVVGELSVELASLAVGGHNNPIERRMP